jgi:cytochrome c553
MPGIRCLRPGRQQDNRLHDEFKHSTRNRAVDAPMKAVVANLNDDQMIAIAGYLGTLKP